MLVTVFPSGIVDSVSPDNNLLFISNRMEIAEEKNQFEKDLVVPFLFDELPIKGKLIVLEKSWQEMIEGSNYDELSQDILGKLTLSTIFFGSALKFDGLISSQLQDFGHVALAFVECTDDLKIRGILKPKKTDLLLNSADIDISEGKLALNIKTERDNKSYQSIIPISSTDLTHVFQDYLCQSDQINSKIIFIDNQELLIGLIIQQLPLSETEELEEQKENWENIVNEIEQLNTADFIFHNPNSFLQLLFPEHNLRVFDKSSVKMECSCSREKIEQMIILLGQADAKKIIEEQNQIAITCELCKKVQTFNKHEVDSLFANSISETK